MALEGGFHHDTAVAASKSKPRAENNAIGDLRTQTVDRLWSITENLNILYRENWTKLAAEEVLEFQEALFRALKNTGNGYVENSRDGSLLYHHHSHRWSFSSSFLYSLTLITTIGKSEDVLLFYFVEFIGDWVKLVAYEVILLENDDSNLSSPLNMSLSHLTLTFDIDI